MSIKPSLFIKASRVCFVLYTITLLTATHWPKLTVQGPIPRTDLVVHLSAFGLWTLLLGATQWIRSSCCIRRQALMVGLLGVVFGWFDELTQPLFTRVFDLTDVAANMTGAILAAVVLSLLWYRKNGNRCRISHVTPDSLAQPPVDARS